MRNTNRTAFTIVELLVVIAIIGVLIALIVPAVQMARESARATQCSNNLRQIGFATMNHEAAQGHFPTGGWGGGWAGDPDRGFDFHQPGGWMFNILPFIEESSLHDMGKGQLGAEKRLAGVQCASTVVGTFICPSRRAAQPYPFSKRRDYFNIDRPRSAGHSDYAANMGHRWCCEGAGPKSLKSGDARDWAKKTARATGIVFPGSMVRTAQVTDGLTHTYLIGEKYLNSTQYDTGKDFGDDQSWDIGYDREINRTTQAAGSRRLRRDEVRSKHSLGFGSAHSFGVNFLLADGSVKTIDYSIDQKVHDKLGNRKDSEIIDSGKL